MLENFMVRSHTLERFNDVVVQTLIKTFVDNNKVFYNGHVLRAILMPFFYRLIFIYLYWEAIIMALDTKAGVVILTFKYNKSLK